MTKLQRQMRRALSLGHTCLGLLAGMFFVVLGLSGGLLALKPQLERAMYPESIACRAEPALKGLEEALEKFGNSRVDRIYFAADQDARVHVRLLDVADRPVHVVYNSCTQKVMGQVGLSWLDWITDLHHNFLGGKQGRKLVGAAGIALLSNALMAVGLWLLSNPHWKRMFSVETRAGARRIAFDLHRAVGLAVMVLLLGQAVTGIYLSYPQTIRDWLGEKRVASGKIGSRGGTLPLQRYVRATLDAEPHAQVREMRLSAKGLVSMRYWLPGDWREVGTHEVELDRGTAAVVRRPPPGPAWSGAMTGLHYADWGGLGPRLIGLALGLSPVLLSITGVLIWWLPRRAAARRRALTITETGLAMSHKLRESVR